MINRAAIGLASLLTASLSQGFELRLQSESGYDSNPFLLAESFGPQGSTYVDAGARLRLESGDYRLEAATDISRYQQDSAADSTDWHVSGRYRTKHQLFGYVARSQASVRYSETDKSFVSRNTGEIATFGGQSIADRFDKSQWRARGQSKIYFNDQWDTKIKFAVKHNNYVDYDISGLSNFDYLEIDIANELVYQPSKQQALSAEVAYTQRIYDDKAQRDLYGAKIADTDLAYGTSELALGYEQELTSALVLGLTGKNIAQRDNGSGYYNYDDQRLEVELAYEKEAPVAVAVSWDWQNKTFANSPEADPNNDGEPSKKGYKLAAEATKTLTALPGTTTLTAGAQYASYDSSQTNYIYERSLLYVGLEWELK